MQARIRVVDEEAHRVDRHHLEGIDLLVDLHRAELRRESAADLGAECQSRDQWSQLARLALAEMKPVSGDRPTTQLLNPSMPRRYPRQGEQDHDADRAAATIRAPLPQAMSLSCRDTSLW